MRITILAVLTFGGAGQHLRNPTSPANHFVKSARVVEENSSMTTKIEASLELAAALLVLFTAMLDPIVSAGLAVVFLIAVSCYTFIRARQSANRR